MAARYGKTVFFKCSKCGKSLRRFDISNAWAATATTNMKYCCPSCNGRYESEGWVSWIYSFFMLPLFLAFVNLIYYKVSNSFEFNFLFSVAYVLSVLILSFYFYGVFRPLMPLLKK